MMKLILVVVALALSSSPSLADCMGSPGCGNDYMPNTMLPYIIPAPGFYNAAPVYDDTPVGKAMAICARHEEPNGIAYPEGGHPPYPHAKGWEACDKIAKMWESTEIAREQREAVEQEKRDREFVKRIAGGQ